MNSLQDQMFGSLYGKLLLSGDIVEDYTKEEDCLYKVVKHDPFTNEKTSVLVMCIPNSDYFEQKYIRSVITSANKNQEYIFPIVNGESDLLGTPIPDDINGLLGAHFTNKFYEWNKSGHYQGLGNIKFFTRHIPRFTVFPLFSHRGQDRQYRTTVPYYNPETSDISLITLRPIGRNEISYPEFCLLAEVEGDRKCQILSFDKRYAEVGKKDKKDSKTLYFRGVHKVMFPRRVAIPKGQNSFYGLLEEYIKQGVEKDLSIDSGDLFSMQETRENPSLESAILGEYSRLSNSEQDRLFKLLGHTRFFKERISKPLGIKEEICLV